MRAQEPGERRELSLVQIGQWVHRSEPGPVAGKPGGLGSLTESYRKRRFSAVSSFPEGKRVGSFCTTVVLQEHRLLWRSLLSGMKKWEGTSPQAPPPRVGGARAPSVSGRCSCWRAAPGFVPEPHTGIAQRSKECKWKISCLGLLFEIPNANQKLRST